MTLSPTYLRRFACASILLSVLLPSAVYCEAVPGAVEKLILHQQQQIDELKKEVEELKKKRTSEKQEFAIESVKPSPPPTGNVPGVYTPTSPSIISDIGCRPKLVFYPTGSRAKGEPPSNPDNSALFPKFGYISDPPSIGQEQSATEQGRIQPDYCNPLYPTTRLLLENLMVSFNQSYTNVAGYPNVGANVPITQTAGNTYQFGVGFVQKPILKQLRAVFYDQLYKHDDEKTPSAVTQQGTLSEDLLFNALTLNAGMSFGKTLTIKNGTAIQTLNSRPSYYAGLTLSWNVERLYIHLAHPNARPADDGYYFRAPCPSFWYGPPSTSNLEACPNAPQDASKSILSE